jgi:DNA-binding response OmpR family regulator
MRASLFSRRARILIVEDEALIGLTVADLLMDDGFQVIGPVATRREALSALENGKPDAVVLDAALKDGFCAGLARELQARSVPFLVFSGHRQESIHAPELQRVPWIEKPGRADEIIATLSRMVEPVE